MRASGPAVGLSPAHERALPPATNWGAPVGRAITLAFAVGTLVLIAYAMWRLPPVVWPLLLANVLYEGLAAGFAVVQTRATAHASSAPEVILPVVCTWLYPLVALAVGDHMARHGLGVLVVAVVLLLAYAWLIWAILVLRRNFSILPEVRALVTGGPYRWVRHPLYLGYAVTWLAGAWQSGSPLLMAVAVLSIVLFDRRAAMEERRLSAFVPAYAAYMARTWRMIPGTGRRRARPLARADAPRAT